MARDEKTRDERRMTFVVIPHGGSTDLSTRSYEISYRRLRALAIAATVAVALVFLMAASWVWVAAQAARVPVLRREVAELQQERQERERLARTLARMQATYEQIRVMLKGELPPLDSIEARTNAAGGYVGGDSTAPPPNPAATDTAPPDSAATGGGEPAAMAAPDAEAFFTWRS
ncbi:MAG TPA: hypothetical protein VFJ16_06020 [Longimicrobium sp.]|nr:hypothetical protein [Longimicrobium sp.]